MIATIIDADPGRPDIGKQLHDCPNCGAVTTIEALEREGCPYCWTQFLMSDLCPKISNYYLRPIPYKIGRKNQKRFHRRVLWGAVLAGLALCAWGFVLGPRAAETRPAIAENPLQWGVEDLLSAIVMFLVLLFFSDMANGVWSFVRAMFRSAKEIAHEVASAGSKKDLTSTVSQLDPAFDYEYFETKTLSLARLVAFEDDLASCPQYAGPPLDERLSRLVTMRYRGSIALDGIGVVGEDLVVDMRVFVEGTFDEGDIRVRNETLHLRMSHQAAFPVDPTFTITAVTCDGCGSGFDATRSRTCRTCARPYDPRLLDWMVTSLLVE